MTDSETLAKIECSLRSIVTIMLFWTLVTLAVTGWALIPSEKRLTQISR